MHYYSESDIRSIVESVVSASVRQTETPSRKVSAASGDPIPVEVSARHVHLTQGAVEILFGKGARLTPKRDLSQHGQFLSSERLKIVTAKGEFSNVAVLGPVRSAVQVELSMTDSRTLGLHAPVKLSGELEGAADVVLIGPAGAYHAAGSAIIAKAHIHMTAQDAAHYRVKDGQKVCVKVRSDRPVTLDDVIIRVTESAGLAMHIDLDEANATAVSDGTTCVIC